MIKAKGKTLVQILAEELKEWPEGVEVVTQSCVDGELYNDRGETATSLVPAIFLTMHQEKVDYPQVTRPQWEAERARLSKPKANKDGWVRNRGRSGVCPVEPSRVVKVRDRDGIIYEVEASALRWHHIGNGGDIMAWSPISAEQSSAEKEFDMCVEKCATTETGHAEMPDLTPIDGPLQWRDRITEIDRTVEALEEERVSLVQRLADEGLQLLRDFAVRALESAESQPDMADWRNWKDGDLVECVKDGDSCASLTIGKIYTLKSDFGGIGVIDDDGDVMNHPVQCQDCLRFHSRPTK